MRSGGKLTVDALSRSRGGDWTATENDQYSLPTLFYGSFVATRIRVGRYLDWLTIGFFVGSYASTHITALLLLSCTQGLLLEGKDTRTLCKISEF
jgi:hypothetical protein